MKKPVGRQPTAGGFSDYTATDALECFLGHAAVGKLPGERTLEEIKAIYKYQRTRAYRRAKTREIT